MTGVQTCALPILAPGFKNKTSNLNLFMLYFSFLMIAVYTAIGLLFLCSNQLTNIVTQYRPALGIVFLVYASFRTILTFQRLKKSKTQRPS